MENSRVDVPDALARKNVLLVEDHAPNALVVTSMLDMLGYNCDVASNGADALSKFSHNHYDLILMDIQMPVMDGWETTLRIRNLEHEADQLPTPVVAMTARVEDRDRMRCADVGMNGFISKPFDSEMLTNILKDFVPQDATVTTEKFQLTHSSPS